MILRSYKQIFFTNSGPKRPFAKKFFESSIEDILHEWETNHDTLLTMDQEGGFFYKLDYIDSDLLELRYNLDGINLSFSGNFKHCVVRQKFVPEGNVRERFELAILEQVGEEVLSEKDESYIERVREFKKRGCESQLCIEAADIRAINTINDRFSIYTPDCKYVPGLWTINLGTLEQHMNERFVQKCPASNRDGLFALAVRSAIYQSESVEQAIELANAVFKECGCGRRLSDDELLKFNVDLDHYHKYWPHCYIGEKSGFYFVTYDFDCQASGVTDKPEEFEFIINDAAYTSWALAAYSGGGLYRCGGRPV